MGLSNVAPLQGHHDTVQDHLAYCFECASVDNYIVVAPTLSSMHQVHFLSDKTQNSCSLINCIVLKLGSQYDALYQCNTDGRQM